MDRRTDRGLGLRSGRLDAMTTNRILYRWTGVLPALVLSALALASVAVVAGAQTSAGYNITGGMQSQSERAVRLSYVDGTVNISQNGEPITEQAVANMPLIEGMTLTSGDDGKAEIQFEDGSVARLTPDSSLTLTELRGSGISGEAEVSVDHGLAYIELQGTAQSGPIRVRFGGLVATSSGFTILRVENDTPPGAVGVLTGNARVEGSRIYADLRSGQWADFSANGPNGYSLSASIPTDSWDRWNADRDEALNEAVANQTTAAADVAPGQAANPAWSDLDAHGSWYNVPGEGYVWSPYEASYSSFDPYGNGNWVWMPRYGYIWVSGYSWGYTPYSCGMWNYYDSFGWGWAPGFGGCSPWWSSGSYYGPRFGRTPIWYNPVRRPEQPRPVRGRPMPVVPVRPGNRQDEGPRLPSRDRNTPVRIGGATVTGMRPFPGSSAPRHGVVERGNQPGQGPGSGENRGTISRPGNLNPRPIYNQPPSDRGNGQLPANRGGNQPSDRGNGQSPSNSGGNQPPSDRGNTPGQQPGGSGPGQRTGGSTSGQQPGNASPGQQPGSGTTPPTGGRGTNPSPSPAPTPPTGGRGTNPSPSPAPTPPTGGRGTNPSPSPAPTPTPAPPAPSQEPGTARPWTTSPRPYYPPTTRTEPTAPSSPAPPTQSVPRTYNPPVSAPPAPEPPRTYTPPVSAPSAPVQPRTYTPPVSAPSAPEPPRTYTPPVSTPSAPVQPRTYTPPVSTPPAPVQPRTYTPPVSAPAQPRTYSPPPSAEPSRPSGGSFGGGNSGGGSRAPEAHPSGGDSGHRGSNNPK